MLFVFGFLPITPIFPISKTFQPSLRASVVPKMWKLKIWESSPSDTPLRDDVQPGSAVGRRRESVTESKMQLSHVLEFQPYWTPEKSNHETQISFVSFSLELFVARSVVAVASGACSECLYRKAVYGTNTPSHKEWAGSWSDTYRVL